MMSFVCRVGIDMLRQFITREFWQDIEQNARDYVRVLFDFSFTEYLTIQLLPIFYGIIILGCLGLVIYQVLMSFISSMWLGLLVLLAAPFAFLVLISVMRALFEFYIVIFRIAEDVDELVQLRDSVERLSGLSEMANRIPFWKLITSRPRATENPSAGQNSKSGTRSSSN